MKPVFFLLILILILVLYFYMRRLRFTSSELVKVATVILTRGYKENSRYSTLILRNKSLINFYKAQNGILDNIIFHEGDITPEQQIYIQNQTPELPLKFYPVKFMSPDIKDNDICHSTPLSDEFNNGYKNMCYFWSIGFIDILKSYKYIFRIDEDCEIKNIDKDIFKRYKSENIVYSSPYFQGPDDPDVVVGMKTFFDNFMKKNGIAPKTNTIKNPYTNVFIMDLEYFRNNKLVTKVLSELNNTNCIFINRWGDLPIWGYILSYLIDPGMYIRDKTISYTHGSHNNKLIN